MNHFYKSIITKTSGFGSNAQQNGERLFTKDGQSNVQKLGLPFWQRISIYHSLLMMPRWKFLSVIFGFYIIVNFSFASLYYSIGVSHIKGVTATNNWEAFGQAFFFSIQTFTTVGYGHMSPSGFVSSFVAALEAFVGLLSFAIATGLLYGRFSKPNAYILFSEEAVIAPYEEGTALMMRLAPYKNTNLTDAYVSMTLRLVTQKNGKSVNDFYTLALEMYHINSLSLNWTLVHPITPESPLYGIKEKQWQTLEGEVIVFLKVFDEMFSTQVVKRTSYLIEEIKYGARFVPMFFRNQDQSHTDLHLNLLNKTEKASMP